MGERKEGGSEGGNTMKEQHGRERDKGVKVAVQICATTREEQCVRDRGSEGANTNCSSHHHIASSLSHLCCLLGDLKLLSKFNLLCRYSFRTTSDSL